MSNVPGELAKALKDALPSLDYNKMVSEARRHFGIVVLGDATRAEDLLTLLRAHGEAPSDVKLTVWRFVEGNNLPVPLGKTELAIVVPATEEHMKQARDHFAGVATFPILLQGQTAPDGVTNAVTVTALDEEQVRNVVVPALVERMWERRLPLGRALPATRDRIAWRLITQAARDPKMLLSTVAGAGSGRSGAPTPATATLLIQQSAIIVHVAAVYGCNLDDRRAIFARVAPSLTPTLLLDGAEAFVSGFAAGKGKDGSGKERPFGAWYGPIAAYALRPTLSASSTLLAGLAARRIFRGAQAGSSLAARTAASARAIGKRAVSGVAQGAALAAGVLAMRSRHEEPVEEPAVGTIPVVTDEPPGATTQPNEDDQPGTEA